MTPFRTFAVIDWSGGNDTGPTPRKDAIWAAVVRDGVAEDPVYLRNRVLAFDWLSVLIETEYAAGRRLLIGFDFPFGYPAGFAHAVTGSDDPLRLWDFFAKELQDTPEANNRFDLAGRLNRLFPGTGPFWFNATSREIPDLPRKGTDRTGHGLPERRRVEEIANGSFPCWQMGGAGAVGGQVMTGLATLARLRSRFPGKLASWPFEPLDRPVALVEIWPSLIAETVAAAPDTIKDRAQVRLLARALSRLPDPNLAAMLDVDAPEEGWILGVGHEAALARAASDLAPPPLRNDCFALPAGVDWVPVDDALARLRETLSPVTATETLPLADTDGRILAEDAIARRSNPPAPNAAVDGYGFAHAATGDGPQFLPLTEGRAAAGAPFHGTVPKGHALRILTGAVLPDGVDTIVLEEDTTTEPGRIAFNGPVKPGANTRKAGEDVAEGDTALTAGRRLGPQDLALLSALGLGEVPVRAALRVGVLSTGDELAEPGDPTGPGGIWDANRPMLLSLASRWGHAPVDLGIAPDDRDAIAAALDEAAESADAILTSGGASAGDEDHISAILRDRGQVAAWRIALKPGRPLMLGLWNGVPVFGMPGNPVAAFVCALVFARPALSVLAGAGWTDPVGFTVPAAFAKSKKPGRREYLRARLDENGHAETFRSEGSGRISGLSWADGLVELPDEALKIEPGDPVRYLPFAGFGL